MLTLRGQRLLNNLLAGSLSAVTLEAELADPGARFALREMLDGSPRHARILLGNTTARTAMLGSALARGILVECRTALTVAAKERDILLALAADANTRTAINASTVALRAIASDDSGAIAWLAQLMNVGGNYARDPFALFKSGVAFAASAPALFLIAVSPALAAAMCLAGRHDGQNATIDATLTSSALFTRIANDAGGVAGPRNGLPEIRWQDDALLLAIGFSPTGSSGTITFYGSHPQGHSRKTLLLETNTTAYIALSFCAPRGLWYETSGNMSLTSIMFITYVAK